MLVNRSGEPVIGSQMLDITRLDVDAFSGLEVAILQFALPGFAAQQGRQDFVLRLLPHVGGEKVEEVAAIPRRRHRSPSMRHPASLRKISLPPSVIRLAISLVWRATAARFSNSSSALRSVMSSACETAPMNFPSLSVNDVFSSHEIVSNREAVALHSVRRFMEVIYPFRAIIFWKAIDAESIFRRDALSALQWNKKSRAIYADAEIRHPRARSQD